MARLQRDVAQEPGEVTGLMRNRKVWLLLAVVVGAGAWISMAQAGPKGYPDHEVLMDPSPGEWLNYGRDHAGTHHSPLDRINAGNVDRLGLAWTYDTGSYPGQLEGSPIVADGTMYGTLTWSVVFAIDARTGEEKWRWDPGIPQQQYVTDSRGIRHRRGPSLCCGPVNRGVALYDGKVYVGLLNGSLVALDAGTGEEVWRVQVRSPVDDYSITGAPRVIGGLVITGISGAEFGVRGFVSAYDAQTGELAWRFYTVPGDPTEPFESEALERAAETWTGAWWRYGGGGTVWDGMAWDPELDLLYFGVGNGGPWPRDIRSPGGGDNLYLASIMAVRPATGEYVWHYQTTPGDDWDYAATQPLILADLVIDGRERKVIMQAPKNGFFYVIDRVTGEFISAEAFARVTWATGYDPETGRPIETDFARYGIEGALISPGSDGAHNWHATSWNPATGLVYLPGQETSRWYSVDPDFAIEPGQPGFGMGAAPAGGRAGERGRCGDRGASGRSGASNGIAAGGAPRPGNRPHGGRNRRLRSVPGRVGSRRPGGALATPLRAAGSQRGNAHDRREPGVPRQRQRVLQRLSRGRRRDAVGVPARARLRQSRHIHAGRPAVRVRRDRSRGQLRAGPGLHLRAGRGAHPAVDGEPGTAATALGRAAPRRVPGRDGRSGAARPSWKGTRPADLHPVPPRPTGS